MMELEAIDSTDFGSSYCTDEIYDMLKLLKPIWVSAS